MRSITPAEIAELPVGTHDVILVEPAGPRRARIVKWNHNGVVSTSLSYTETATGHRQWMRGTVA